jgi:hypothetical protein
MNTTDEVAQAYAQDAPAPIQDDKMKSLRALAQELADCEAKIAELTEKLEDEQRKLKDIAEERLPSMMESLGIADQTFADGLHVAVVERIFGSIPKDKQEFGFNWLDEQGKGGIIKRQFVINFGRDQTALVNKFAADLKKRKVPLNVETKLSIHPQTLLAFIKEELEKGTELPEEGFSIHRKKIAAIDIKLGKKTGKKK